LPPNIAKGTHERQAASRILEWPKKTIDTRAAGPDALKISWR